MRLARSARRGFTILEVATVAVILGIAAATAVPFLKEARWRAELREVTKQVAADLANARALARSGRANFEGWSRRTRLRRAGLRFTGPRSYEVYVDGNRRADGVREVTLQTVGLEPWVQLVPSTSELRFRRNGTLQDTTTFSVTVRDARSDHDAVLEVAYGGAVRVRR